MTGPLPRSHTAGRALPDQTALAAVEMLLLDVDGVLTDGRIWFDREGNEGKSFHVHDAAGMFYWHRAGGRSGLLSGRASPIVARRAEELGFLFPDAGDIGSAAVVPLYLGEELGVVAVGSSDANRYHSGMGTLFLTHIADVIVRCLPHLPREDAG